jgi:hypothetical protein
MPLLMGAALMSTRQVRAADHDDTNALKAIPRHDGRITDLHVFTVGDRLILSASTNPNIPKSASSYTFPSDLAVRFHIDGKSNVDFSDPNANATYGGTIKSPRKVGAAYTLEVTFDATGRPELNALGLSPADSAEIRVFAGLRDDPFIRAPRRERNVAAVVIEAPLRPFRDNQDVLLVWATTSVPSPSGAIGDLGARALRSQFAENLALNDYTPAQHATVLGVTPDVIIFDTGKPAAFPNGRALTDDVVDLVGDSRVLSNDSPFPTTNDRPFLGTFPYLATPHPACGAATQACCAIGAACDTGSVCNAGICQASP